MSKLSKWDEEYFEHMDAEIDAFTERQWLNGQLESCLEWLKDFCVDDKRHYEVVSSEMGAIEVVTDDGQGPMEYWCDWVLVLATSKRDATKQAIKHRDFHEWVDEARGAGINPFSGVKATLATCGHGKCWGCPTMGDDEWTACEACNALAASLGAFD